MKLRTYFLAGAALLGTAALAVNAQVPGVNSTLNSVFTLVYDASTMMPTYSAFVPAATPAASAQDVCTLTGSASKVVKVRRVWFSSLPSVAVAEPIALVKRSTASTGAGATMTLNSYDSANPASSVRQAEVWTANPVAGTFLAAISDLIYSFPVAATAVQRLILFGELGQPIVLRGVNQSLSINLGGITYTGTIGCTFEWTEQ